MIYCIRPFFFSSDYLGAVKTSQKLLSFCEQELYDNKSNLNDADDWFMTVCSRPHLVVWVKLGGYPWWPAKAIGTRDWLIDARFFGKYHSVNFLRESSVRLFSIIAPKSSASLSEKHSNDLKLALQQAGKYIQCIEQKFGKYKVEISAVVVSKERRRYLC